jgi:tetratricopeptide (TPR) repeat protein
MRILILGICLVMALKTFAQISEAQKKFDRADYEEAYTLFKEASLQHIKDDEPIAYVQCNLMMGECKVRLGEPENAEKLASNTMNYVRKYFPENRTLQGQTMTLRGKAYLSLGRNDLALTSLKEAEKMLTDSMGLETAECFSQMGIAYWQNGNQDLAVQYMEQALKIRQERLAADDIRIGDVFNNLGLLYQNEEPLQALIYFNRAKRLYERNYGTNHAKTALVSNNLAFSYAHQGSFDEAFQLLEKVRNIYDALYEDIS